MTDKKQRKALQDQAVNEFNAYWADLGNHAPSRSMSELIIEHRQLSTDLLGAQIAMDNHIRERDNWERYMAHLDAWMKSRGLRI